MDESQNVIVLLYSSFETSENSKKRRKISMSKMFLAFGFDVNTGFTVKLIVLSSSCDNFVIFSLF